MRIIKEVPHPYLKITVFKHQFKVQVKVQHEVYETLLTFRDGEILDEQYFLDHLEHSQFIKDMEKRIFEIHQTRMTGLSELNNPVS